MYLIKGENGVGKSTLLYSMLGLSNRYVGDVIINNKKLSSKISYNDISFTAAQSFISRYGNIKEATQLSSGQTRYNQMKFNLADKTSVIIVDEPTNYLDVEKNELFILVNADSID